MHGLVHTQFKTYVEAKHGRTTWTALLESVGAATNRVYMPIKDYPDEDMHALVAAMSKLQGVPEQSVLQDFGYYIVSALFDMYGAVIKPNWRTLDLLEHTESAMHAVVRANQPGASPPKLAISRVSPTAVVVTYRSPRKMCGFGKGIIRGIADHYGDEVAVEEQRCMLRGGPECVLQIVLLG